MPLDFKKRLSLTKNPLALPNLVTISLSASTSDVTTLPNYVHCDVLLILVSVFSSLGVYLIIQSTATMNNKADITHPCLTPDFTRKFLFEELYQKCI